jgi:predicted DNA-binding WGR domain protein
MRQLSFAFLQAGHHIVEVHPELRQGNHLAESTALRRIDPKKNMARFYSLDVERDLFGKVVLVRRWGRTGTAGKIRLDEHAGEREALTALQALRGAKLKKGYQAILRP